MISHPKQKCIRKPCKHIFHQCILKRGFDPLQMGSKHRSRSSIRSSCLFHHSKHKTPLTPHLKVPNRMNVPRLKLRWVTKNNCLSKTLEDFCLAYQAATSWYQMRPADQTRPEVTKKQQNLLKMWKCNLGLVCCSPLVPTGQCWNHINKKPLLTLTAWHWIVFWIWLS